MKKNKIMLCIVSILVLLFSSSVLADDNEITKEITLKEGEAVMGETDVIRWTGENYEDLVSHFGVFVKKIVPHERAYIGVGSTTVGSTNEMQVEERKSYHYSIYRYGRSTRKSVYVDRITEDSIKLAFFAKTMTFYDICDMAGNLKKGQEEVYPVKGKNYKISLEEVTDTYAKFKVDGETSKTLKEGESFVFTDGSKIYLIKIQVNGYPGDVEFYFKRGYLPTGEGPYLTTYPTMFFDKNKFFGSIVVGDKAPPTDVLGATNIAVRIQAESISPEGVINKVDTRITKLSSEISNPYKMNVISVGNPGKNPTSSVLMGNIPTIKKYLKKGEGLIKAYSYNDYVQIVVAGYTDDDTRKAAEVLANYEDYDLRGDEFRVTGTLNRPIIGLPAIPIPIEEEVPIEEDKEEIETEVLAKPSVPTCDGCLKDNNCLPFGTRITDKDVPKFCDITKEFSKQKEKEESCQNNYECKTNQCTDGECSSIKEELKETRSLLKKILNWLNKLFGK